MIPFLKVALSNLFKKPSTRNFPAHNVEAKPAYRGRISFDGEKCRNCGMCVKVCSPAAITRTEIDTPEGKDIKFEFDLTSCTFCGMCQDFCDEKAITLTDDYHMVATDAKDLISSGVAHITVPKGKLVCGDECVYCTLCAKKCPEGAITVDRAAKTWSVDHDKCTKCGTCVSVCPKKTLSFEAPKPQVVALDSEKCVYCTLCAKKCPEGAITVDRAAKTWEIDTGACVLCGKCIDNCPKKALSFKDA